MKRRILALCVALAGCASLTPAGTSPEAQIATGAQTVTAATTAATVALRNHAITLNAAENYRDMLAAAGKALHGADADLQKCRADTGSTAATRPDPCWPKVADVVTIALQSITAIRQALPK